MMRDANRNFRRAWFFCRVRRVSARLMYLSPGPAGGVGIVTGAGRRNPVPQAFEEFLAQGLWGWIEKTFRRVNQLGNSARPRSNQVQAKLQAFDNGERQIVHQRRQ